MPARALLLALLLALAACGGGVSQAEVREARAAEHALTDTQILEIARGALGDYYRADESEFGPRIITEERAFLDGVPLVVSDRENVWSAGDDRRHVQEKRPNQWLRLRVRLRETPSGGKTVLVEAMVTDRWRTWDYSQPGLPSWAQEEADALQVRIHRALERAAQNR
jgi:hypothetical protein